MERTDMNTGEGELLTGDELCQKLKVKKSFLYAPARRKGPGAIPCIMIGKYLRYDERAVRRWFDKLSRAQG
ncbi:MAG: helix-turn-helix domain-containing protein [Syntrophus sp. (in: bacteria)]